MKPVPDITHENAPAIAATPNEGEQKGEALPMIEDASIMPNARKPVVILGMKLPEGSAANTIRNAREGWGRARTATVKFLPAFIVNNSSNILGAAHVGTEMLMFKSSMGKDQSLIQNPKNPINWIVEPLVTVPVRPAPTVAS